MFIIQKAGGTVSLVGTPQVIGTDINPDALAIGIQADTTNKALQIVVTGLAGTSIRWIADVEALEPIDARARRRAYRPAPFPHRVTAMIPHRDTPDLLRLRIRFLERQTERP